MGIMSNSSNNPAANSTAEVWTHGLAAFLAEHREVEALRVNLNRHQVQVATIGQVDLALLRSHLLETIRRIQEDGFVPAAALPDNLHIAQAGKAKVSISRPTCPTAPRFFKWTNVDWPEAEEEETGEEWRFLAVMAGLCAVFGLSGWVLGMLPGVAPWLPIACYIIAMIAGGWDALADVRKSLPRGEIDIHFLMLAVAVGASAIGAWAEGALLLFLFSVSGAMEHFALYRTKREINSLFDAAPKTATLLSPDGSEQVVRVEAIRVGDVCRIKPGEQFPVDGEIISGKSAADESNLTGEANPVAKQVGDAVFSGTINLWGAVQARTVRPASESALQKVIRLIREAQHLKAPSQRFTDRFGTGYTIGILAVTTAMFLVWWLGFGIPPFMNSEQGFSAFYRAMTLLVVASPCALVLSIPSAILAAIAWGARHGILFRGGAAIEKLAEVDVVALDKTGTLTTGEMEVIAVESFPQGRETEVAELAYSLEASGSHPIGRAIRAYGKRKGLRERAIEDFHAMSGKGVQGRDGDVTCVLGRRELLEQGPLEQWMREVPEPPAELVENWVLRDDLIGRILLRDEVRQQSSPMLKRLRDMGVRTIMLTGDRRSAAESVGREIGIDEVRAGLKPEDKVAAIRDLANAGRKVAMVGDGVNDAPSLAAAYVSAAMGARGSDSALEQSEVILMEDRIDNFVAALRLSIKARAIIRQNVSIALGTVAIMAAAAILGLIPLTVGVIAHEGSTVVVCLNSLRLLFHKAS